MTPEEARTLLDRLKQAGNIDDPVYAEASDAIIPMLETIAGMRWEYAVQVRIQENGQWHQVTEWNPDPNPYKPGHAPKHNERLVRRSIGSTDPRLTTDTKRRNNAPNNVQAPHRPK